MRLSSFHVQNFRRLKDVRISVDPDNTIFVGANNSGKTSATHVFRMFFPSAGTPRFTVHDFSVHCWKQFDDAGLAETVCDVVLPKIQLDLWFDIENADLHRVIPLLPNLDWEANPVGVRILFKPTNPDETIVRFREALSLAESVLTDTGRSRSKFQPWPKSLSDYLDRKLSEEYGLSYSVLDRDSFDEDWVEDLSKIPHQLASNPTEARTILATLVRIDFMDAQRFLSDTESSGKSEDLSRRLGRFYKKNLDKYDDNFEATRALADSEQRLNEHLAHVFKPTLDTLNKLGYPGFADPELLIRSEVDPESIFSSKNTSVHYGLGSPDGAADTIAATLPGRYNGLGFKNLIYMVIEMLDFEERWIDDDTNRAPLHLIVVEEPEAHLHAQLQQVFINQIRAVLTEVSPFHTQLVVTTHSSHIIYECGFSPIRYFRRSNTAAELSSTKVLDLSTLKTSTEETIRFLRRYMKLTHCDLFFADAVVLVEGNVERILLPLMIERVAPNLKSRYLTILDLGGAFAYRFRELIEFLGLTTLIITDLDSVAAKSIAHVDE